MALDARTFLLYLSLLLSCWLALFLTPILAPAFIQPVMPLLLLPCLHAWDKIIPAHAFPISLLFLSGILADHLLVLPLGALTLCVLCLKATMIWFSQKQSHEDGFWMHWLEFGMLGSGSMLLLYGITSLFAGTVMPVGAALLQALLTFISYPVIYRLYYGMVCAIIPSR